MPFLNVCFKTRCLRVKGIIRFMTLSNLETNLLHMTQIFHTPHLKRLHYSRPSFYKVIDPMKSNFLSGRKALDKMIIVQDDFSVYRGNICIQMMIGGFIIGIGFAISAE